ncbi:hypothetical protein ACWCQR_30985, partial [Streptomyces sp. NPDC002172]
NSLVSRPAPSGRETANSGIRPAAEGTRPSQDLSASPEYREHLARVLTRRAVLTPGLLWP